MMNYFKIVIILTIMCLSQHAISQYQATVTFSPLTLSDVSLPKYKVGYIHGVSNRIKTGLDIALGNGRLPYLKLNNSKEFTKQYQLWEIRPEIYYIFNPDNKNVHWYSSLSLFYIRHTDTFTNNDYVIQNRSIAIKYSKADYIRKKYGVHGKIGFFTYLNKHFGLNIAFGVGGRIRKVKYLNVIIEEVTPFIDRGEWTGREFIDYEGIDKNLDLFGDFRIIYRFKL